MSLLHQESDAISRDLDTVIEPADCLRRQRRRRLFRYLAVVRPHHYPKNVLVVAGIILACLESSVPLTSILIWRCCAGMLATCLIASSNYVLNEILDATCDRFHPRKNKRPLVVGDIALWSAFTAWFALLMVGMAMAALVGMSFLTVAVIFQGMAMAYNVPPVRLKDLPYIDVLCEAANSPLRLLLGWVIVVPWTTPSCVVLLAFWSAGGWAMARKRLIEIVEFDNRASAAAYRKSFAHYDESRLRISVATYATLTILFCVFWEASL